MKNKIAKIFFYIILSLFFSINLNSEELFKFNVSEIKISQDGNLFQGFGGVADLKKNKLGLDLSKTKLLKVEQEILYEGVKAYTGLILANKKYKINESNVNLLERQVETDQVRLEKSEISLADLAQSESSLAGARAKFIEAKNEVITNKLI